MISEREAKRKKWRPLQKAHYPAEYSQEGFFQFLEATLIETSNSLGQMDFVCWLYEEELRGFAARTIVSPNEVFNDTFCDRLQAIIKSTMLDEPMRTNYQKSPNAEMQEMTAGYSVSHHIQISDGLNCLRLRCDPQAKKVKMTTINSRSTDFSKYPNRLTTTDEAFEYIAALTNSRVAFIGNLDAIGNNGALIKLLVQFLDSRGFSPGNLLVNADDTSEWDYRNDEIDVEIGNQAAT